jgi:hypothetical protein
VSIFPLAQTQAADLAELLFGSFCVRSPGHPARGFFLFWQPPGPPGELDEAAQTLLG